MRAMRVPNWHLALHPLRPDSIVKIAMPGPGDRCDRATGEVELDQGTRDFYVRTLTVLNEAGVPYLVGGAYAMGTLAGIERHTKDIDLFARERRSRPDPPRPRGGRLPDRDHLPPLAGQGLDRRAVR